MSYENVKLWFAHKDGNIVTIDEINEENKNENYSCPVCGSELKPKAIKSKQVSSHFAHIDSSKCNSETMIHWWFKHKFLEVGDTFTVVSDKERQYIVKEVMVEQSFQVTENTYKPDVIILTECENTIYFEMAFSNKKKVKDYLDIWLELKNIVVEIDIKQLMLKNEIPTFKALFYDGKCFNTKRNDSYYNVIGKYKEEKLKGKVDDELKGRIRKLDWFWEDVFKYRKNEIDIENIAKLIDSFKGEEKQIVENILKKQSCNQLHEDYINFHKKQYAKGMEKFKQEIKEQYGDNIKVKYDENLMYHSITILSNLRNPISYNLIGSTSGGCNFNIRTLNGNIEYIKECIKGEVEDLENIEKQNKIIKNESLHEAIEKINKKYKEIDELYNLKLVWNGRHNVALDSLYKIYLSLMFADHEVTSIDITSESTVKTNDVRGIYSFIDGEIHKYRNKLTPITNKNNVRDSLNSISEKYKEIRNILPQYMYKQKYTDNEIVNLSFKDESHIGLTIYFPFQSRTSGYFKWKTINIYEKKIEYWNEIDKKYIDYEFKYETVSELEDIVNRTLKYFLNNAFDFECIECKDSFSMGLNEIEFFSKQKLHLPKRCKMCRKKRKAGGIE